MLDTDKNEQQRILDSDKNEQQRILAEIWQYYDFMPPFFLGIVNNYPLLSFFWQETQQLYIHSPFPQRFKEQLFIYLSYYRNIPYDLRCHCITLHNYGMTEQEIVTFLTSPQPGRHEILRDIQQLNALKQPLTSWPVEQRVELALLTCIVSPYIQQQGDRCQLAIAHALGPNYSYLIALLTYINSSQLYIQTSTETHIVSNKDILEHFYRIFAIHGRLDTLLNQRMGQIEHARQAQKSREKTAYKEYIEAQSLAKTLQEVNQRMNDSMGLIAHEIRTPLTTIKGTIQVLLRRAHKDIERIPQQALDKEELLRNIHTSQRLLSRADGQMLRLTNLIDDILCVTRIQEQRLDLHFEPFDLNTILLTSVEQQRKLHPERIIVVQMPKESTLIYADCHYIEQVISNYLTNAIKYSDKHQPIKATIEKIQQQAQLSVQDNGIGIADEDQPHIWELFYRAREVEVRNGSSVGFGMGLYISHSIIEQHGGEVMMYSEPQKGSTFCFSLPLHPLKDLGEAMSEQKK
jgi:Osmosensitive K+ channel histidine kinase